MGRLNILGQQHLLSADKIPKLLKYQEAFLRSLKDNVPNRIGLILGTGWSDIVVLRGQGFLQECEFSFADLGINVGNGNGHPNRFLIGTWHGKDVVISQGRVHLYQEAPDANAQNSMIRLWMALLFTFMGKGTQIFISCSVGSLYNSLKEDTLCLPSGIVSAHLPMPYLDGNAGEFVMSEHLLWAKRPEYKINRTKILDLFNKTAMQLGIERKLNTRHIMVPGPGFGGATERNIWSYQPFGCHTVGMSLDPELRLIALENIDNSDSDQREAGFEDKIVFPVLLVTDSHDLPNAEEIKARAKAMAPRLGGFLSEVVKNDWGK